MRFIDSIFSCFRLGREGAGVKLVLLLATTLACYPIFGGQPGNEHGNGGDPVAADFIGVAQWLGNEMGGMNPRDLQGVDVDKWEKVVQTVHVNSVEHTFLDGVEVDAINYPAQNRIEVNRARWEGLETNHKINDERHLVLHEVLWVAGYDDTNYHISNPLLNAILRRTSEDFIEDSKKVCDAVRSVDIKELQHLVALGVDLKNCHDADAETPLEIALKFRPLNLDRGIDDTPVFQILLNGGADPNHLGRDGWPLLTAVQEDDEQIVSLLLQAKANVNAIQPSQEIFGHDQDALGYYLWLTSKSNFANGNPIPYHPAIVQALLSAGEDPNQKQDYCDETIVMRAVKLQNDDTINFFLSKATKINWCEENKGNKTVLDLAIAHAPQYVNRLISAGAKTDKDCGGKGPVNPELNPAGYFCR